MDYSIQNSSSNGKSNFINVPTKISSQLAKGYAFVNDIIRSSANLNENISKLEDQLKKDKQGKNDYYLQVISGLLYGILYDGHNNYYQYLYVVTKDNYEVFFQLLFALLESDHMDLPFSVFVQVYDIIDKLVHMNNSKIIDIVIVLCRCVYPGIGILEKPNELLTFLEFIKNKLNWIMENSNSVNLIGLVFFKIARLLTETHIYSNANNPDTKQREAFQQIKEVQIFIINRLWTIRQDDVLKIGKELIRILIPLSNTEIEVIVIILETLTKQSREGEYLYHQLIASPHPIAGYNAFVQMNIPPLMEKMLIFILTKVKRSTGHYQRYFTWLNRKFRIETAVGQTMLIDISRYIVTCYFFYKKNSQIADHTPRWLVLGYLLNITKNELLSGEIKQALFFDWLQFNKERDHVYLIEPGILIIFQSARDYFDLTMELIEFLDKYCECFDSSHVASIRYCVYEAFKAAEANQIIPDLSIILKEEKIETNSKEIYSRLITPPSNNSNYPLSQLEFSHSEQYPMSSSTIQMIRQQSQKGVVDLSQSQLIRDLQIDNEQNNISLNTNTNSQLNITPISTMKTIEGTISIAQPLVNLLQPVALKNFLSFKSTQTFNLLLDSLCQGYLTAFAAKNELEWKLITLKSEYISLINHFVSFYLQIFKEELLLPGADAIKAKVSLFFFEYLFIKSSPNELGFLCDIARQLIESHSTVIVLFIHALTLRNIKAQEPKAHFNLLSKVYSHDIKQLKEKMNQFFTICVDNFDSITLNFVIENGFIIFHSLFYDDEELICNLLIYSSMQSINSICLHFLCEQFILFDKSLYPIIALSLELSQIEQNKLWLLITSQFKLPSTNLKEFIGKMAELSHGIVAKGASYHISFFKNILNAVRTCFKAEVNEKGFGEYWAVLEFNVAYAKYVHRVIVMLIGFCSGRSGSGMFFGLIDEFIKWNNGNEGKMRNMILLLGEIVKIEGSGGSLASGVSIGASNSMSSVLFDGNNTIQKLMSKFEGRFKA